MPLPDAMVEPRTNAQTNHLGQYPTIYLMDMLQSTLLVGAKRVGAALAMN